MVNAANTAQRQATSSTQCDISVSSTSMYMEDVEQNIDPTSRYVGRFDGEFCELVYRKLVVCTDNDQTNRQMYTYTDFTD